MITKQCEGCQMEFSYDELYKGYCIKCWYVIAKRVFDMLDKRQQKSSLIPAALKEIIK